MTPELFFWRWRFRSRVYSLALCKDLHFLIRLSKTCKSEQCSSVWACTMPGGALLRPGMTHSKGPWESHPALWLGTYKISLVGTQWPCRIGAPRTIACWQPKTCSQLRVFDALGAQSTCRIPECSLGDHLTGLPQNYSGASFTGWQIMIYLLYSGGS